MSDREKEAAIVGVARLHAANLLKALGFVALARSLRRLVRERHAEPARVEAQEVLSATRLYRLSRIERTSFPEELIGNVITRAGPIPNPESLSPAEQQVLHRLQFRPVFVGLERRFVSALIQGEVAAIRQVTSRERHPDGMLRTDGAGTWLMQIGEGPVVE